MGNEVLTFRDIVKKYNQAKPKDEPILTRTSAVRAHEQAIFKLRLALRKSYPDIET